MSKLISNYEISVWEDVLVDGKFIERKICVIGSDQMNYQGKVQDPQLTRKSNGEKRFSFSLYKRFVDNFTGEKVLNPFSDFLINERKVKLHYENKWYDFIIKNIQEDSSTYLYKYSLEDALVQELSKNGFDKAFDPAAMNNLGSVSTLATRALEDTDWEVESDIFTERVEESLVYLNLTKEQVAYRIYDDIHGDITNIEAETLPLGTKILAFYSSCKNKPHRFQFIYLNENQYNNYSKELIRVDENHNILELNCQYYIDIDSAKKYTENGEYFLPPGFIIEETDNSVLSDEQDTLISNWFRGKRFGFSLQTEYVPVLERYCNRYKKNNQLYYGYLNTDFASPLYTENIITNSNFKSLSGWTGSYCGETVNAKKDFGTKITSVFGHFVDLQFQSAEEILRNGTFAPGEYKPFLKIVFPDACMTSSNDRCLIINSGFYDNRFKIGNVAPSDKWRFEIQIRNNGEILSPHQLNQNFSIGLYEVKYNASTGKHDLGAQWGKYKFENRKAYIQILSTLPEELTPKEFQKKKIYLVIAPLDDYNLNPEIYIESIKMYKEVLNNDGEEIAPEDYDVSGVVVNEYHFALESQVKEALDKEDIVFTKVDADQLNYNTYQPVYNDGAEKIRTITIKESNYFNILSSIAETFEAWLELSVEREDLDNPGQITRKVVKFKKYLGSDNYAAFRYGVNLNSIQRTYESKELVTKLVVKPNKNELAPNGFCTIAYAGSNPTGESNIYDFRYFHNTNLLPAKDYVAQLYYPVNPYTQEEQMGLDIDESHEQLNIQNYFNRLKRINDSLIPINEEHSSLTLELIDLMAEQEVQEGIIEAAEERIGEIKEDFVALTGFYPEEVNSNPFVSVSIQDGEKQPGNPWSEETLKDKEIIEQQIGTASSTEWHFDVDLCPFYNDDIKLPTQVADSTSAQATSYLVPVGVKTVLTKQKDGVKIYCNGAYNGMLVTPTEDYVKGKAYELSFSLKADSANIYSIGIFTDAFKEVSWSLNGGDFKTLKHSSTYPYEWFSNGLKKDTVVTMTVRGIYTGHQYRDGFIIMPNYAWAVAGPCTSIISNLVMKAKSVKTSEETKTFKFTRKFIMERETGTTQEKEVTISCAIPGFSLTGSTDYSLTLIDTTESSLAKMLTEYVTQWQYLTEAQNKLGSETEGLIYAVNEHKSRLEFLDNEIKKYSSQKAALNKAFYSKYSRFIREGTWISEEYVDDDKYYNDALSVLYNSCFPQVEYTINVIAVSALPGFEHFKFELGDKTYAEDPDFFGTEDKIEVVITEQTDYLDTPEKNSVKVQNFKNQFKDLFQKITATVQQVQYTTGSYEKAVALVEANNQVKSQFISGALAGAQGKLAVAGQTTVTMDKSGITLTDSATKDEMRLIGGAILMSSYNQETGERKWRTGLTPEGISASLITAGTINAGEIMIMNAEEPVFRWDAFGLSAFDVDWSAPSPTGATNPYKFVRFDKHGVYGISSQEGENGVDGRTWKPTSMGEIDELATFALTWDGLKVTGDEGIVRIGKYHPVEEGLIEGQRLISIWNTKDNKETLAIGSKGDVSLAGHIEATSGKIGPLEIAEDGLASYSQVNDTPSGIYIDKYRWWSLGIKGFAIYDDPGMGSRNPFIQLGGYSKEIIEQFEGQIVNNSGFRIEYQGEAQGSVVISSDTENVVFQGTRHIFFSEEVALYGSFRIGSVLLSEDDFRKLKQLI